MMLYNLLASDPVQSSIVSRDFISLVRMYGMSGYAGISEEIRCGGTENDYLVS